MSSVIKKPADPHARAKHLIGIYQAAGFDLHGHSHDGETLTLTTQHDTRVFDWSPVSHDWIFRSSKPREVSA